MHITESYNKSLLKGTKETIHLIEWSILNNKLYLLSFVEEFCYIAEKSCYTVMEIVVSGDILLHKGRILLHSGEILLHSGEILLHH